MFEKTMAVFFGSLLIGLGINGFLVPHHLLDGGIIGIGLIFHYYFGWPTGLSMILLSIPLYILAWHHDRQFFYNSLHGLIISSLFIDLLNNRYILFQLSMFWSSVLGGVLVGSGIGLMLRYKTSTGGTDLLAQLIGKITSINVGILIFIIDGLVILSGLKIVGFEKFCYSFITIIFVGIMTTLTLMKSSHPVNINPNN
ncbi:YitT family protein [Bacillus marasmi]|uniref:YitT family protein n=1 Tax=Bacillus marasmi TaxID=1926279 RepID=UPI0011C73F76|nr:YitT family protein [Bacillus marasmi]